MSGNKVDIRERLTPGEAQVQGLVPTGHVWSEAEQRPVERGTAIVHAQLAEPMDLAKNLEEFQANRKIVLRFVAEQMVECEYNDRGYPIPGKMGDYYKVPGSQTKALTKRGGENLGQFFRFAKGETKVVSQVLEQDFCSTLVEVTLLDKFRRPVGSAASACTTAEPGFRSVNARKKYGARYERKGNEYVQTEPPDYRAAFNDIVARAGKRAYVQAIIFATATDEIFHVAEEDAERARQATDAGPPERPAAPVLPFKTKTYPKGTKLSELSVAELLKLRTWIAENPDRAARYASFAETLDLVLEERRDEQDEQAPL